MTRAEYEKNLNLTDLEKALKEAKKGIAKVDKIYVNYNEKGHLFDYNLDYNQFLSDISNLLKIYKEVK
jgi:hypothetical protein